MKKSNKNTIEANMAPFPDEKSAAPVYGETIMPADLPEPTPGPTPPGAEPMAAGSIKSPGNATDKTRQMEIFLSNGANSALTTAQGLKISDNQNTLKAGERGPSLMQDFLFTEKLANFGRERIPERVVHARGSGAHGYFEAYDSLSEYTSAAFLQKPGLKTPVFVRFSTVQGFRGSADTVRDIRGFATKFYTSEGNFDLVGNNTPVFFIQDAIKFPDFVHAVKPEPNNEMPQGQSAHDSFWDYISLQPETLHNVLWAMSDRGIPRSYRMMEGFGIHTYRFVNAAGKSCFVRFHWKPVYGAASLIWDEAQLLAGRDPDYHRKDLWQGIEAGDYPEFELGLQIIPEEDEKKFGFDILDATKLIPEALAPVKIVGKMVLNRNPDNFFAETEQVAFCPANIVPGIDFSDDPLLQGRIFSYTDTQRYRLGGPNFNELPINRPLQPAHNNQRDGMHRMRIDVDAANYGPNSISENWPREIPPQEKAGGFATFPQRVEGSKIRQRSPSFADYYSQPRLFWLSQTPAEQDHIVGAFSFELGKVARPYIRERIVDLLTRIDGKLAAAVAANLGITLTEEQFSRKLPKSIYGLEKDPSLSLYAGAEKTVKSKRAALLATDGVNGKDVGAIYRILREAGVHPQLFAPRMGTIRTAEGEKLKVDGTIEGNPSVLVDAVVVPGGKTAIASLMADGDALYYLLQAYRHLKPLAFVGDAREMPKAAGLPDDKDDAGLIMENDAEKAAKDLVEAMKQHRIWSREKIAKKVAA